jgi:acylphosphatase
MDVPTDVPTDVRVRLVVSGRVQGVFFRDTCRATALQLGVRGWVRNRSDGSVEVVAEGPASAVGQLAHWCRTGPARAVVTGVEITDEEPTGVAGFRVTR